jgi:hypothetical protein
VVTPQLDIEFPVNPVLDVKGEDVEVEVKIK